MQVHANWVMTKSTADEVGNKAFAEWLIEADHTGPLVLGDDAVLEATGRHQLPGVTVADFRGGKIRSFPANALGGGDAVIGTALNTAASIVLTIGLIGLTTLLFDKARGSGPMLRRAVTPVAAVFTATVAWFVISLYVLPAYPGTASAVRLVDGALGVAIPMAILLGLVGGNR